MTDLFPYQIAGAEFLAARSRALLADAPRVGKTAAAIRAADLVGAKSILWVTTGSARWDHAEAWKKFSVFDRVPHVILSGKDPIYPDGLNIISSDLLPRMEGRLRLPWDVVVLDESHRFKTPTSKRTEAVYGPATDGRGGVVERAKHVWCLSGTPAPNNYSELWPMLRALDPDRIALKNGKPAGFWSFTDRYCILESNGFGTVITGSRNGQDLKARMEGFSLRRTLEQIAPEVPRLRVDTLPLDAGALLPAVNRLARQFPELQTIADMLDAPDEAANKGKLQSALHSGAEAIRQLGLLKVYGVADWISEEPPAKRVVFAWHTDVINGLSDNLEALSIGSVILDGSVVGQNRQAVVERFRSDDNCMVLIGQIVAAGEGIDLSCADEVIFIESSWVPGHNEQASRRVVNVTKTRPTNARFVVVPGTVDERIQNSVARKIADIAKLF